MQNVFTHPKAVEVFEHLFDSYLAFDRDWRIVHINAKAAAMSPVPAEKLLGQVVWEALPQYRGSILEANYRRAMAEQRPITFDYHGPASGKLLRISAFPSSEGMVAIAHDLTQQHKLRQDLTFSHERLRLAMASAGLIAWDTELATGVTQSSEGYERLWGCRPTSHDDFRRLIHPDDYPALMAAFDQAAAAKTDFESEFRIIRPDGEVRWVSARATILLRADGSPERMIGVSVDITDSHRLREEIQDSEARLRLLNDTLEQRIAAALVEAEELNDQLRAMAHELALTESRERRRIASFLHDGLAQMLVVAKMRLGSVRVQPGSQQAVEQIAELLDQCVRQTRQVMNELSPPLLFERGLDAALQWLTQQLRLQHGVTVELNVEGGEASAQEDVLITLYAAVRELLMNIVKHARVDHAAVHVRTMESAIEIVVSDHGAGFDSLSLQAPGEQGGFGLLQLRERIRGMGGSFEIDSSPGSGTRTTLSMPRGVSVRRASTHASPAPKKGGVPRAARRVLIVDDHRMVREGLRAMLDGQDGIEVVGQAADGRQALELMGEVTPDVVLMDINMPAMNGIEATRMAVERYPRLRVIGLSMHEESYYINALMEAGAKAVLAKDEPFERLLGAIQS